MNYHFRLARYGYSFDNVVRIAARLAVRTGVSRLVWANRKGRAHIIAEGPNGYRHEQGKHGLRLAGNVPPHDSIDWQRGALVECTPCFAIVE